MISIRRQTIAQSELLAQLRLDETFLANTAENLESQNLSELVQLQRSLSYGAEGAGANKLLHWIQSEDRRLPPQGWNRAPQHQQFQSALVAAEGYSAGYTETVNALERTPLEQLKRLANRRHKTGEKIMRLLAKNPEARRRFEEVIGGQIIGSRSSVIIVERFSRAGGGGAPPEAGAPGTAGNTLHHMLGGMELAILGQAERIAQLQAGNGRNPGYSPQAGGPFSGVVLGGLGNVLAGGREFGIGLPGGQLGGLGAGSWNPLTRPGQINNTGPIYEGAHQNQLSSILHDPSLTVEDKVTLLLMAIADKQDKDILRQGQYIAAIQQQFADREAQQRAAGGFMPVDPATGRAGVPGIGGPFAGVAGGMTPVLGGAGLPGGAPFMVAGTPAGQFGINDGDNNSPSIDVETMKLKRMIDKRSQMFDMLRSIIDKYNETAKNIIQSVGR